MKDKSKDIKHKPIDQNKLQQNSSQQSTVKDHKVKLPSFFDKHPEIKTHMINYLKEVPDEQKEKSLNDFYKFVNGDLTWGEIRKISKRMQKELARIAYLNFKMQRYKKAETLFKGLAVIDHTNWYYRAALGAIYQKKRLFEKAVDEYSMALDLRDNEITSLVNRGECYMMLKDFEAAIDDFAIVTNMNLPENNPWYMRARILKQRVLMAQKEDKT